MVSHKEKILTISELALPEVLTAWIGDAPVYESSGASGARTVYIDRDGGIYLKIAEAGSLSAAAQMQTFLANRGFSSKVLQYLSADRDYLLTSPLCGQDGTSPIYLSDPQRLSVLFGQALRQLHTLNTADCPTHDKTTALLHAVESNRNAPFLQSHLDDLAAYIGPARAVDAAAEIISQGNCLIDDVVTHGDYCLPNILLDDWHFSGFIDVADGGVGDRHYDLAWGLWTLHWNLKTPLYGHTFLDAYGRDAINPKRLRVCGLLAAMD